VISDVDGVLTDTGVYYSERGEELKRFSVRDGMGIELLREAGVKTGFLTREKQSGAVIARANKLAIPHLWMGVRDKAAHLEAILQEVTPQLTTDELAYIGDDVNDLGIIRALRETGLTAAPADAMAETRSAVLYVCQAPGGHGAFRDFADWLLGLRRGGE
jgi:3-deoxy-D-manno-octulosonate 8-phosphate phosphatase (KDO 8-P phosphatase)